MRTDTRIHQLWDMMIESGGHRGWTGLCAHSPSWTKLIRIESDRPSGTMSVSILKVAPPSFAHLFSSPLARDAAHGQYRGLCQPHPILRVLLTATGRTRAISRMPQDAVGKPRCLMM
jgi:hypothetical protein